VIRQQSGGSSTRHRNVSKDIAQASDGIPSRRARGNDHRKIRKRGPEPPAGDTRRLGDRLVGIGLRAETNCYFEPRCRCLRERRFQHEAA
jgi:hypothetical protein